MKWRILVTCPPMLLTLKECQARFRLEGLDVVAPKVLQQLTEQELCAMVSDFDGVIAGDDPFTAKVLETGRRGKLRVLAKWGVGVDAIDREAAKKLGISVSNTPGVFNDEVADVALGYLLLLARQLHKMDAAVRRGEWLKIPGVSLRGKTAGIIGVGGIGQAVARRFLAVGMNLVGYDLRPIGKDVCEEIGLEQLKLDDLLKRADCIVLACNLTRENRHLLNAEAFAKMKKGVWIINVARGALIDQKALLAALEARRVERAALDVFEEEPLPLGHPLSQFEHVILGTHNSSNTKEAVLKVNQLAIDNLVRDLNQSAKENK
ncbi:MAG: phosphoglycerate dehydrogenase [Candidatus Omnitrophica bacterium]|nr:phosphoglycerate dehydrogenase [Candidatus Omnitrophota bacterium]